MKLFNETMNLFFAITRLACFGVYIACLFGVGLPLLPIAIGAHLGIWFWDWIISGDEFQNSLQEKE
jgi:hypothetical protein